MSVCIISCTVCVYACKCLYLTVYIRLHADWDLYMWTLHYRDLETPSQSINALLLKYARVSTGQNGMKLFNSKRPQHWYMYSGYTHTHVTTTLHLSFVLLAQASWANCWIVNFVGVAAIWIPSSNSSLCFLVVVTSSLTSPAAYSPPLLWVLIEVPSANMLALSGRYRRGSVLVCQGALLSVFAE